jgi:uncharacterized LabA/DUF88 family protein
MARLEELVAIFIDGSNFYRVLESNEEVEKGVDVRLATNMLKLAWADAYDTGGR